uniref:Uncharacterized protein n=1 Tax=Ixodes ricinus TaxID=34613 RepID=A0A6B0UK35_IXORI
MNFFFVAVSGLHVLGEGSGTVRFFGTRQVALDARRACIWVLPTPSVSAFGCFLRGPSSTFVRPKTPSGFILPPAHISRPIKLLRVPLSCIWQAQKWLICLLILPMRAKIVIS